MANVHIFKSKKSLILNKPFLIFNPVGANIKGVILVNGYYSFYLIENGVNHPFGYKNMTNANKYAGDLANAMSSALNSTVPIRVSLF